MRSIATLPRLGIVSLILAPIGISVVAATLPAAWQNQQQFEVSEPGLIKLSLPLETIDAARSGLEDLRIYDGAGLEVPYFLHRSAAASKAMPPAKSLAISLQEQATLLAVETGFSEPLDAVTLQTPASSFIKAVQVEGSKNGRSWQKLAEGLPIFRQPAGVEQLEVSVPQGVWPFLRFTIDDRRSAPIPFTGARVHGIVEPTPTEPVVVTIAERQELPGETRLKLNLDAANLKLASIRIETPEPLFMRGATLVAPAITAEAIQERTVAQGVVYRVAVEGQPVASNLLVAVEAQISAREVFLVIQNQDSPPLPITEVSAAYRPVYVTFLGKEPGPYYLLTGNRQCPAPRYDLAALGGNLKKARLLSVEAMAMQPNPSYRPAEALPGVEEGGATLDVSAWKLRKRVELADATAQQLELDVDVLAHSESGFQDLRIIREGRQIPYILQRTSLTRALSPLISLNNDPRTPKLSRWTITLSHAGLPITRLVCSSPTPLFARTVLLYENVDDDRGGKNRRGLGEALWTRTPYQRKSEFVLEINDRLQSNTLILDTDNGDNPAIELEAFKVVYPVTRVLFKAKPGEQVFLYYGNHRATSPRYDLGLMAGQLLGTPKGEASLGQQEQLRKSFAGGASGKGGPIFWTILGLVVVVLLVIIARLLPKAQA